LDGSFLQENFETKKISYGGSYPLNNNRWAGGIEGKKKLSWAPLLSNTYLTKSPFNLLELGL
jgi:hypothetical protein